MSKKAASNILVARACVDSESVGVFFEELEKSGIGEIPPENILNYDETNFRNDSGKTWVIVRRGRGRVEKVSEEYPEERFSPPVLVKYNQWIADGKPEMSVEDIESLAVGEEPTWDELNVDDETIEYEGERGTVVSYFVPLDGLHEMKRFDERSPVTAKNFRELCLQRLDETPKRQDRPTEKRNGVNPYGAIVTSDMEFQKAKDEVERKENEKKEKEEAKRKRDEAKLERQKAKEEKKKQQEKKKKEKEENKKNDKRKSTASKQQQQQKKKAKLSDVESDDDNNDDDGEEEEEEMPVEDVEDDPMFDDDSGDEAEVTDFKRMVQKASISFSPITHGQALLYMQSVWAKVCPPVLESAVANLWFTGIYNPKNTSKSKLFIGKVIRRFLKDKDEVAQFLELDCMKEGISTTTI